jgi:hypothetical protein
LLSSIIEIITDLVFVFIIHKLWFFSLLWMNPSPLSFDSFCFLSSPLHFLEQTLLLSFHFIIITFCFLFYSLISFGCDCYFPGLVCKFPTCLPYTSVQKEETSSLLNFIVTKNKHYKKPIELNQFRRRKKVFMNILVLLGPKRLIEEIRIQ